MIRRRFWVFGIVVMMLVGGVSGGGPAVAAGTAEAGGNGVANEGENVVIRGRVFDDAGRTIGGADITVYRSGWAWQAETVGWQVLGKLKANATGEFGVPIKCPSSV
ncbi:hypothetical protein STSP2_01017 [Anaerohalosphaera lusitana]|uniref:Uncharacterized protein n=1 Tax=Anaerohalosphaera lusitana TaxID=1936003 RepID=A0A1U9NJ66_9BACT|nr:hypothetical protein [Anaerohalosphaera lusitana]AQT67865.1 hypothetical protein STSP2_01017 [Anaerohalosphaera lusitana]